MSEMANQGVQQAPQGEGAKVTRRMLTRDALVASICGFVVVLMVGAVLQLVLPHHRLQRHHPGRDVGAF